MSDNPAVVLHLNDQVVFRMTHAGALVWCEHLSALGLNPDEYVRDTYRWPPWEVMSVFGPHTFMGMPDSLIVDNELRVIA